MSNTLRRAEGLDDDPSDVLGLHHFADVVRRHRNFVRDVHRHALTTTGGISRYQSVVDEHADQTLDILRMHLSLWNSFDEEQPN